ncbi:Aminotransferase-like, plant mobile domain [Sesbania bispinosa]|nr:Aminotransferase-like, plant mobile domain [Sesbania bispinosa]
MDSSRKQEKHKRSSVQPRGVQKYCDVKLHWRVKEKLNGSGFDLMFDMAHKDIFRITGLPIDGKPVCFDNEKLGVGEFANLTGLECDETTISLKTLVDGINNSYDEINNMEENRLDQICRIVALLGISCMIMQETHSKIRIRCITLVRDVANIKNYAWGAASWTNLHSSMIRVKSGDGTNLFGSVFALMVFALVRIPKLIPYVYKERVSQSLENLSFPMMIDFINIIGRDEMVNNYNRTSSNDFEALLLNLDENDVKWTYEELSPTDDSKYYDQERLGYSVTTCILNSFAVKHQPHLAPRQFPYYNPSNKLIQQWVEDFPTENAGRKKRKGSTNLHKKIWEQRWNQLISMDEEALDEQESPQLHELSSSQPSLPSEVKPSGKRKRMNEIADLPTSTTPLEEREFDALEMERMLLVGLLCVHPDHEKRPRVRDAARMIKKEATLPLLPPSKPRVRIRPICPNDTPETQTVVGDWLSSEEAPYLTPRSQFY